MMVILWMVGLSRMLGMSEKLRMSGMSYYTSQNPIIQNSINQPTLNRSRILYFCACFSSSSSCSSNSSIVASVSQSMRQWPAQEICSSSSSSSTTTTTTTKRTRTRKCEEIHLILSDVTFFLFLIKKNTLNPTAATDTSTAKE